MDASGIIASSGKNPQAEREMTISCHVPPGHYTVLCAAYKTGDEGPFTLTIHSNWPVKTAQLWPPAWKKAGLEGPKQTIKQQMIDAAKKKAEKVAAGAAAAAAKAKAKAKAAAVKHTDWVDEKAQEDEQERERQKAELAKMKADAAPDPLEEQLKTAKKLKMVWREKTDPQGNKYWYNKQTSVSTFDKPEGFMNKKEIRALEIQVDTERTRKRVERGARRGAGNAAATTMSSSDED